MSESYIECVIVHPLLDIKGNPIDKCDAIELFKQIKLSNKVELEEENDNFYCDLEQGKWSLFNAGDCNILVYTLVFAPINDGFGITADKSYFYVPSQISDLAHEMQICVAEPCIYFADWYTGVDNPLIFKEFLGSD